MRILNRRSKLSLNALFELISLNFSHFKNFPRLRLDFQIILKFFYSSIIQKPTPDHLNCKNLPYATLSSISVQRNFSLIKLRHMWQISQFVKNSFLTKNYLDRRKKVKKKFMKWIISFCFVPKINFFPVEVFFKDFSLYYFKSLK